MHLQSKNVTYGTNWELRAKCDLHVGKEEVAKHTDDARYRGLFQLGFHLYLWNGK